MFLITNEVVLYEQGYLIGDKEMVSSNQEPEDWSKTSPSAASGSGDMRLVFGTYSRSPFARMVYVN